MGFKASNQENYLLNTIEGQLIAVDMINNAYLKHRFKNITIVSGVKLMPLDLQLDENVIRVINLMGAGLFPLCLCMLLPVFLY